MGQGCLGKKLIIKVDILGLRMLSAIEDAVTIVET